MQQQRIRDLGDGSCCALVAGAGFEKHADLTRCRRVGIEPAENGIVPVRAELGLVFGAVEAEEGADAIGEDLIEDLDPGIDLGEDVGVSDANERDRLVAGDRTPFELDRVLGGGFESGSFDAHGLVVHRPVHGLRGVQGAGWFPHPEGIGVLVEHVRGHGGRSAGAVRVEGPDGESRVVDVYENPAALQVGRAEPAALDGLRRVPGRSGREAARERERCDRGGVGGAAGKDDVGSAGERICDGFEAHEADDVFAGAQHLRIDRSGRGERLHRSGGQSRGDGVGGLLAVDGRQSETKVFLAGDRIDHAGHPVDACVRSGGCTGRDDQRDVGLACRRQQNVEIVFDRGLGCLGRAGPQVVGTGVGGATVNGDRVRSELDAACDRLVRETAAEHAGRKDDSDVPCTTTHVSRRSAVTALIGLGDAPHGRRRSRGGERRRGEAATTR